MRLAHLSSKLTEAEEERRAELAPDIRAARDDVALLRSQLANEDAKAEAARQEVANLAAKLGAVSAWGGLLLRGVSWGSTIAGDVERSVGGCQWLAGTCSRQGAKDETISPLILVHPIQLQLDVEGLRAALEEERDASARAEVAPGKARHAADQAVAALRALREEEAEVAAQLRAQEAAEAAAQQVRGRDGQRRQYGAIVPLPRCSVSHIFSTWILPQPPTHLAASQRVKEVVH